MFSKKYIFIMIINTAIDIGNTYSHQLIIFLRIA